MRAKHEEKNIQYMVENMAQEMLSALSKTHRIIPRN